MICPRHHAIASNAEHGQALCSRCFIEALKYADAVASERSRQIARRRLGLR